MVSVSLVRRASIISMWRVPDVAISSSISSDLAADSIFNASSSEVGNSDAGVAEAAAAAGDFDVSEAALTGISDAGVAAPTGISDAGVAEAARDLDAGVAEVLDAAALDLDADVALDLDAAARDLDAGVAEDLDAGVAEAARDFPGGEEVSSTTESSIRMSLTSDLL